MTFLTRFRNSPVVPYAVLVFTTVIILFWQWWLWGIDPAIPLNYWGDSIPAAIYAKGIIENGWYLVNPFLGMPDQMELYDYPLPTNLPFLMIKLLSAIFDHYAVVLNLYVALCFVLSAVTAFFVLNIWTRHRLVAFIGSLLYAFQPYQIMRGWQGHIFLVSSFLVPFVVLIVVKLAMGTPWTKQKLAGVFLVILLVSAGSIYYSFFTAYFLMMGGLYACIYHRKFRSGGLAVILIVTVLLCTALNLSPTLLTSIGEVKNTQATARESLEAEHLGLRISNLLLPTINHRIPWVRRTIDDYNKTFDSGESHMSSLGLLASAGFLFLLVFPFFRKPGNTLQPQMPVLSFINFAAVILAVMGSLGSLIAYFVTEQLRGYNRISIFIAFFSVTAITLLLDRLVSQKLIFKNRPLVGSIALVLFLAVGLLDQTPAAIPQLEKKKSFFSLDSEFIRTIESSLPEYSMIFQLPDSNFPGGQYPISSWEIHQAGKPYLHSRTLRWTYGAILGRGTDLWQKHVSLLPPSELVSTLIFAGFNGLYIDRNGFPDEADALRESLTAELKSNPIESKNGRQLFYSLVSRSRELKSQMTSAEWELNRAIVQSRLVVEWADGFYAQEHDDSTTWRWCGPDGTLILHNSKQSNLRARVKMQLASRDKLSPSGLKIDSPWFQDELQLDAVPKNFDRTFTVPPGSHTIQFSSKANVITTEEDKRPLAFEVINFQLKVNIHEPTKP